MASAIRRGDLRDEDVVGDGAHHRALPRAAARPPVADWAALVAHAWRENLDELALAGGVLLAPGRLEGARRFADAVPAPPRRRAR